MQSLEELRAAIRAHYLADEQTCLRRLADMAALNRAEREAISAHAADLVRMVRQSTEPRLMEAFLSEYGLSTGEGVALMCLAEALLRVPDAETVDELIRDKIVPHDWSAHSGESSSIFVNASTWALMLTGRVLDEGEGAVERTLRGMIRRLGEPVIRTAVAAAMRELGEQFVLGRTIDEALRRSRGSMMKGYLYSYDMLGEAARTDADALRYHRAYQEAIERLAREVASHDIRRNPGISVKLSALHPRYEATQKSRMLPVLCERLQSLALLARRAGMGLNIDAEEADRLDVSLDVIEAVLAEPEFDGWDGFGIVVQAYGRRAPFVIEWLNALAERLDRRIMVRLVKGAYWDSEIKRAQVMGLAGYPVFTRKTSTDISYIACARRLLQFSSRIYPQFATHNAHTVAAILAMAPDREAFEFQRLHGMGEALHEAVRRKENTRCRIYAPVGAHADLLAYLVRRLLENGANSSFVHQIVDESVPAEKIAADPFQWLESGEPAENPLIPLPVEIFGLDRRNSRGFDLSDPLTLAEIEKGRSPFAAPHRWQAGRSDASHMREVVNPADPNDVVGIVRDDDKESVRLAVERAISSQAGWAGLDVAERAAILERAAELYEAHAFEFFALCAREAGKTMLDAVAELREAVDFLRYYACEARRLQPGLRPRGTIACISPWNFPLAIFTGQIAAALVTGNTVIAKPAEQTPLIAARAAELLHEAGVPHDVLVLLQGDGPSVGAPLVADPRLAGVCFTGSLDVARRIERQLSESAVPEAMLIAETGGLNAMIVDSTALPEQAVRDILASAFQSAGQRCSALRILYVQKDVEERLLAMLKGAMEALSIGNPWQVETDVGPVIDSEAHQAILSYCEALSDKNRLIGRLDPPQKGLFVPLHVFRVSGIGELEREIFGPVLHVASFEAEALDEVISAINAKGYGLTFGLHTRIDARVQHVIDRIHVGNVYINRNQIGAVVGSQPFGGEGLSGTGPKAGGPNYLRRFLLGERRAEPAPAGRSGIAALEAILPDSAQCGWADREDRIAVLRKLLRGRGGTALSAAAAAETGPLDLPGPTGEANTYKLVARGRVLCLGPSAETLLAQVIQALAAGNSVVAAAADADKVLAPLLRSEIPLAAQSGMIQPEALTHADLDLVAACHEDDTLRSLRRALAGRTGPIVPLVTERLYPEAYYHERAVCVDTTAAGGNASLLAAAG
jgi:RHH-type proline utilization regulon transcriptional repressor/proline dehydrogenase/delta 1-pyrroline-5-carboxylate dehydrogenase